jgi:hypothetical protein
MGREGIEILVQEGMSLELELGIAQVPSDVRVGDVFGNREKYNQRKQNDEQHGEVTQLLERLGRPPQRSFFPEFNYASNHVNGEFLPLEATRVARYYPTYRTTLLNLDLLKCYLGTESAIERGSRLFAPVGDPRDTCGARAAGA